MNITAITDNNPSQIQTTKAKPSLHFKNILAHVTSDNISTEIKTESLQTIYNDWQSDFISQDIGSDRRDNILDSAAEFSVIVAKAAASDGYSNPQAFIASLNSTELAALQHTQGLAQTINPAGLSHEGALNLLLPPSYSQDIDNDGIMETGLARGWTFPPRNAPMAVHDAWAESMSGLSQKEQFLASGKFLSFSIGANINPDGSGAMNPEDPGLRNPFADANFSYSNLVATMLTSLEAFKAQTPADQYTHDKAFFTRLLSAFSKHGVT